MAFKGKLLKNPVTGQDIIFLQTARDTGGNLLEMESTYLGRSQEPITHYHPEQAEDFFVIEGALTVMMNGFIRVYRSGEGFHVPKRTVHSMWNATNSRTVMNWQVRPALDTEYLLETTAGLAADGRTSSSGKPSLLQIALIGNRFRRVFRLAKPPYIVQRILFSLLTPFAILTGHKAIYRKYID